VKIDSHQHFWIYNDKDYAWIDDRMATLRRNFTPEQLWQEQEKIGFEGSIVIQARQTLEETRWLLELASEEDRIFGVVGWVDLCSDNVDDQLKKFSSNPKLIGVRHVLHDEPDDRFMLRKDFQYGISLLKKYGLTYDILIFPKHLPATRKLASKFPDQPFVVNHIGKPLIKDQVLSPWEKDISLLALYPNVYCKISGMVTEADWNNWKTDDIYQYLDIVYKAFGEDRLMIGSDWPVCTLAGEYITVMNVVIEYFAQYPVGVQEKIFGGNCIRFYRL
jgi:L-fuconolactonase